MNTDSYFPVKRGVTVGGKDMPAPMQRRSRETASRFVDTALDLLRTKTFAELSVAELAQEAGRSVGVFYQRFGSKDDFLAVLLLAFFEASLTWHEDQLQGDTPAEVYEKILKNGYLNIMRNRNLWHAALERSATDPNFWSTFSPFRKRVAELSRAAVEAVMGRAQTPSESRQMALAGQVFSSVINNQIINGPGPLMLEADDFFPELIKIVQSVALLD